MMDQKQLMSRVDELLSVTKTAVLSTCAEEGPRSRWMTPGIIRARPHSIFCVTAPSSFKVMHIKNPSSASWMVQNKALTEVINLEGEIYVVDDPGLKKEVMEVIGRDLVVCWKINDVPADLVVLETVIRRGSYFRPMDNVREFVDFK